KSSKGLVEIRRNGFLNERTGWIRKGINSGIIEIVYDYGSEPGAFDGSQKKECPDNMEEIEEERNFTEIRGQHKTEKKKPAMIYELRHSGIFQKRPKISGKFTEHEDGAQEGGQGSINDAHLEIQNASKVIQGAGENRFGRKKNCGDIIAGNSQQTFLQEKHP